MGQRDNTKPRSLLKNMKIDEVSFVGRGANQGARQSLFKAADTDGAAGVMKRLFNEVMRDMQVDEEAQNLLAEMMEATCYLKRSLAEIMEDPSIDQRKALLQQSIKEFSTAMASMIDEKTLQKQLDQIAKAAGKTEGGKQYPASDFAFVPDMEKPSGWKLRLTSTPGGPPDPRIVGAAVAALGEGFRGNKVAIPAADRAKVVARVRAAWLKANKDKSEEDLPAILKKSFDKEDLDMDKIEALTAKVDDLTARLVESELRGSMTDVHKAHYDKLQGDAKVAFGKADLAQRDTIVAKVKAADETLTVEGTTIRKSDVGEATFAILKSQQARIDAEAATAKTERETRMQKELETEAETLFPNMAGTPQEKAALLKSVRALPETEQAAQLKMLKSADAAMAKQFTEIGQGGGSGDENSADGKLQKMAKERAEKDKTTIAKAYSLVLETPEGAKLYEETLAKK